MPEEMRFFLRTALYTALITTIYWLVSYEWAGTVMLTFVLGACIFFIGAAFNVQNPQALRGTKAGSSHGGAGRSKGESGSSAGESGSSAGPGAGAENSSATGGPRSTNRSQGEAGTGGGAGSFVRRAVGFDRPGEDPGAPLVLDEGLFPSASLWPLGAALAATLVGLGFIYGAWLWIPGASLGVATGSAWLTQLRP